MSASIASDCHLEELCARADVAEGAQALSDGLGKLMPGLDFSLVLTRGHWHRLGGVVDKDYRPVSDNIVHWAETESGGDIDALITRYMDAGFFATIVSGKTHYFTAPVGDGPQDFIQLEIEELQEVLDRPLFDPDWFPDSLEEFADPLDYPRLEPEPIGSPYYRFRRVTRIDQLVDNEAYAGQSQFDLSHFFQDWRSSSAGQGEPFCRYWVMALRDYVDSDGSKRINARPVSTFGGSLPRLPQGESLEGAELANAIHDYDRRLGYPFAWYFIMLSMESSNFELARAVLRDQMDTYDYLPERDLAVLRAWAARPYAV
jgi:hypothetical protein